MLYVNYMHEYNEKNRVVVDRKGFKKPQQTMMVLPIWMSRIARSWLWGIIEDHTDPSDHVSTKECSVG